MTVNRYFALIIPLVLLAACSGSPRVQDSGKFQSAARANTQLGIEYMRQGDLERARNRLEKAVSMAPDYAPAHDAIAILYDRAGDFSRAEKHFRKSLKLVPDNSSAQNNYGQFLCKQGRRSDAEAVFRKAADNPYYKTPWVPLTNAGICLLGASDGSGAEAYLKEALVKQPKYAPALLNMGKIRYEAGNYLSTRAFLERFQQVAPHTADSLWLAIRTEYALKDHQAWGNYALQLKHEFPDSGEYLQLQEWENERRSGN